MSEADPAAQARRARRRAGGWLCLALLGLLLLFHALANVWWLAMDNHAIRTDEEVHMLLAREHYEALFAPSDKNWLERFIDSANIQPGNPAHPPLQHWAGAAMIAIFGYDTNIIAATNTIWFLLALLGCYAIVRRMLDPWSALFATFVVSFTPIVFVSSRYFMTDYLSMALCVWAVYALIRSDYFRNTPWVFWFAVLNGLGILTRTTSFFYYLVPCMAVLFAGILISLWARGERRRDWAGLRRIAFNAVLTGVVSAGVFAPWYVNQLEYLYNFWTEVHHVGGPTGPLAAFRPETPPEPAPPTPAIDPAEPPPPPPPEPTWLDGVRDYASGVWAGVRDPRVPWVRYPVHAINNGVFLPLFGLSLVGMLAVLAAPRYRRLPAVLMILWLLGAWVLMTVLIKHSTPRYVLQAMPALAMLAAFGVMALPGLWIRRAAMGLLAAFLVFQYGNLTFASYGPIARVHAPIDWDASIQRTYGDEGLAFYKDNLALGGSFAKLGPPTQENFKYRLFFTMLEEELNQPAVRGDHANYLRLRVRGMALEERHFWPEPNPYLLRDLPPEYVPQRRFRGIGMGQEPEHLTAHFDNADYIVYHIDAAKVEKEEAWRETLERHGFRRVERFRVERYGPVPARHYGVFVHEHAGELIEIQGREDIDQLSMDDLYMLTRNPGFEQLSPDLRAYARERLEALFERYPGAFPISPELTLIGADLSNVGEDWRQLRMIIRVEADLNRDWRVYVFGQVGEEHLEYLPDDRREEGYVDWNFDPDPPTSAWKAGDYIILYHRFRADPIPYNVQVGFFTRTLGHHGQPIPLGWVDFGQL